MLVLTTCNKNKLSILDRSSPLRTILNKSYQSNFKLITNKCFDDKYNQ